MRNVLFVIAATASLLISARVVVIEPDKALAQTQSEMNAEACGRYRKSDAELNRIYNRILSEYANDKVFILKLRAAQRAWVVFRDAHIASLWPDPAGAYGSANPMCRCAILEEMTAERVVILKQWIDGAEEGNVCAGSVRMRK